MGRNKRHASHLDMDPDFLHVESTDSAIREEDKLGNTLLVKRTLGDSRRVDF